MIGANGAGKTTFFGALSGMVRISEGEISHNGKRINGLEVHERAQRGIARTFQRIELFDELTALENLVVARELRLPSRSVRGAVWPRRARAGDVADAEEMMAFLGLEQYRNVVASRLPTGVRRFVEVGRALMVDADLYLLDEPAAGLDGKESEALTTVIREITMARGAPSVILVEHDMAVALGVADRVYVLDHGELIAVGNPEEIVTHEGVRQAYLGASSDVGGVGRPQGVIE